MKYLLSILLILSSLILNAQDVVGVYQMKSNSNDFELTRTLTLNSEGTFEYYNYRRIENGIPKETHIYGKGTWTQNKKVISFFTEASDLDDKFTLDFNNSKARFISKSPRDKSDRIIETAIQFYETDVSIAMGLKLIKD